MLAELRVSTIAFGYDHMETMLKQKAIGSKTYG